MTRWRELPAMVVARAGDETVKAELAARFQEAIDEAAMRLGDTGAEDYLEGWDRSPWTAAEGTPVEALDRVAAELDEAWPADRIAGYLDGLRLGERACALLGEDRAGLLDGCMGTAAGRRPRGRCTGELWNLENPDAVRRRTPRTPTQGRGCSPPTPSAALGRGWTCTASATGWPR